MAQEPILEMQGIHKRFPGVVALKNVGIRLFPGEVHALMGQNGAGKSTLLRSLTGLLPVAQDMVRFDGQAVGGSAPHQMLQRGLALVPEGRRLFTGMTVEDNLQVAIDHARALDTHSTAQPWTLDRLYDLFPILLQKRRTPVELLSGGQQQMVAIGRGLLSQPRLLLCDELSLGLAPLVIREIYAALPSIAAVGTAIVLVEQDVALACRASHRLYCMLEGRITLTGRSADIARDSIARAYFGASHAVA